MKTQFRLSCSIFWLIAVTLKGVNCTARYHTGADGRIYLAEVEQKVKFVKKNQFVMLY